jgi:hypothetical protein
MTKSFEQFIKKIKKLQQYYILSQEETCLIVGTKIKFREYIELHGNPFQPVTQIKNREIPAFFVITTSQTPIKKINEFKVQNFSILNISNMSVTLEELESSLKNFKDYI